MEFQTTPHSPKLQALASARIGKVSGTAFIILTVFIAVLLAYFFWPASPAPTRLYEPGKLTEGQCVLQVLGEKGALFEQMQRECRVLVVLNGSGVIIEIIEN